MSKKHELLLKEAFTGKTVLVIGDVMIDTYQWGKVSRISPEAPVPVLELEKTEHRLGGASNVALNLLALGAKPLICSVIGEDEAGKIFLELLRKHKLSSEGILFSSRKTTSKTRIISQQQILRVDHEQSDVLKNSESERFVRLLSQLIEQQAPNAVIFEDYDKGVITEYLIEEISKLCRRKKIPVTVDPKKRNFFSYRKVDLFKPNLRELREGLQTDCPPDIESLNRADKLLRSFLKHKITLVTLSEHGVYVSDGKNSDIIPAHKRSIADVSGAGDTVIATATLCMAAGFSIEQMAGLANLAGGMVCESPGVSPVEAKRFFREASAQYPEINL
jgi:rfaE bifunctional protein kinase chain/domain